MSLQLTTFSFGNLIDRCTLVVHIFLLNAFYSKYRYMVCFAVYNNIWIQSDESNNDDYDNCGKPGGAFLLGVLGVLMGRSGYLAFIRIARSSSYI